MAVSAQNFCANANLLGCSPVGSRDDRALVTIQGDGVALYDIETQRLVRSWALGPGVLEFAAPAAYDPTSRRLFAAVAAADAGGHALLSWPRDAAGAAIPAVSQHVALPSPPAAVVPVASPAAGRRRGDAELAVADAADAPAVFVAFRAGGVALCSASVVLDEASEAGGLLLLAATAGAAGGELLTVHAGGAGGAAATAGRFAARGRRLVCEALVPLAAPPAPKGGGVTPWPLAAVAVGGRVAVLWSDGAFASYAAGDPAAAAGAPLQPAFVRRLRGFRLPAAPEAAAAPAGKKSRKRPLADAAGAGGPALAPAGGGLVAVVGWAAESAAGAALRVVCLDVVYGAVLAAEDLPAGELSARGADDASAVQVSSFGGRGVGRLLAAAGGAALTLELAAGRPSLASLLGALDVGGAAGGRAAAARAALSDADLAALAAPAGAGLAPARFALRASAAADAPNGAEALLVSASATWALPAAEDGRRAEADAWAAAEAAHAAARKGGKGGGAAAAALLAALRPLLDSARRRRVALSRELLCVLLNAASGVGCWNAVSALLEFQHPGALSGCAGLAPAIAAGRQYGLLRELLRGATDLPATDLAAALRVLLAPPDAAARAALREHRGAARGAAEAAVAAAERAAAAAAPDAPDALAAARAAAAALDGFSAAELPLHALLAARHDPAVLLRALRPLPPRATVALLRYLAAWLRALRRAGGSGGGAAGAAAVAARLPAPLAAPPLEAVVAWLAAAVDAGMAKLALRPDAAAALAAARAEAAPAAAAAAALARAKGALEHVACGAPLPAAAPPAGAGARYALEWLDLEVRT